MVPHPDISGILGILGIEVIPLSLQGRDTGRQPLYLAGHLRLEAGEGILGVGGLTLVGLLACRLKAHRFEGRLQLRDITLHGAPELGGRGLDGVSTRLPGPR